MKENGYIYLIVLILLVNILAITWFVKRVEKKKQNNDNCGIGHCKNMDPVSDPKYNMQQIVKQSILLEEHLANKNKRCRDCITKHFLHIIGLAEEAQMLATNKINQYPLVNECVEIYNRLFDKWLKHYDVDSENNALFCCDELRTTRKRLIAIYFFDDEYQIKDQ